MLTYDLESRGRLSLYEYLYLCIKNDIKEGKLAPCEKLPSKRAMAKHLGVSIITVKNAYEQLVAEGYVSSVEKSGYFVSDIGHGASLAPRVRAESERVGESAVFDLSSSAPSPEQFPFSVWSRLLRRVLSEGDEKLLLRVPSGGVYELRAEIARYLYDSRGMNVSPENIIVGSGTGYIYNLLIQLLGRDKKYGVENPGYTKIGSILSSCGMKFSLLELDEFGVRTESMGRCDVIHISPSHHYPTGIVMPLWRRREICEYAREHGAYIIDDDYDSEFRFSGRPVQSMWSLDPERVIYINTFSQTISPSIRISYMVLPDSLRDRFADKLGFYSCSVPSFEQYTLSAFIREGYFDKHINRMRNYYKRQRAAAIDAVNAQNDPRLTIVEEGSGVHFLLRLDTEMSDGDIKSALSERGIGISFVSDCAYTRREMFSHLAVISYTGADTEKMQNALKILSESL